MPVGPEEELDAGETMALCLGWSGFLAGIISGATQETWKRRVGYGWLLFAAFSAATGVATAAVGGRGGEA